MRKIADTRIWFRNENGTIHHLEERYLGLAKLLDTLLNQFYTGKKMRFVNVQLGTDATYAKPTSVPQNSYHAYGGHLQMYGTFDPEKIEQGDWQSQKRYVWDLAFEYLTGAAKFVKNAPLGDAAQQAYQKGLELDLPTDSVA